MPWKRCTQKFPIKSGMIMNKERKLEIKNMYEGQLPLFIFTEEFLVEKFGSDYRARELRSHEIGDNNLGEVMSLNFRTGVVQVRIRFLDGKRTRKFSIQMTQEMCMNIITWMEKI